MAKWPSATGRNAKMLAATERERRFVKRKTGSSRPVRWRAIAQRGYDAAEPGECGCNFGERDESVLRLDGMAPLANG